MVTRRFLFTAGAASIVVIAGGVALRNILHSDLSLARQPWTKAGDYGDPRLNALSYAILAPNPHNRQPWLIELRGDTELTVYCDLNRLLPETDPYDRQITIGLGAFLELLRQAAAEDGYRTQFEFFPEGEPQPNLDGRPIATVTFTKSSTTQKDPLFQHALNRRTVRTPFDQEQPVSSETLMNIGAVIHSDRSAFSWTVDREQVETLKDFCNRAWLVEIGTKRTHHESTALTRIGEKEINQNPDGISLSGPVFEATKRLGIITQEKMEDPSSRAYSESVKFYSELIYSAMAFGMLTAAGDTRRDQLNVGADWMRLHLAATRNGLALQPLSQILQEFPEMSDIYKEFHEFAGILAPARVHGLFRFGYATSPPPAPRWPLHSRLIAA